jgi:hypothetical protein
MLLTANPMVVNIDINDVINSNSKRKPWKQDTILETKSKELAIFQTVRE